MTEQIELIQKSTLNNGLTLITEKIDTVRSISVGIWVKTGSRYETPEQAGITHFLEHMLFKGTESRSAFDIVSQIESRGGYLNAFTSSEYTAYYVRCLDSEIETALSVLSDMVLHPAFPEKEIEKEKKVVLEEMKMYRDSPEDSVFEEFVGQLFANHPLGRPIIGYESTVNSFDQGSLRSFVGDHYRPDNILIAAAGNLDHEQLSALVSCLFESHSGISTEKALHDLTPYHPKKTILTKDIEQTHLVLGKRAISNSDENRFLLLLMNTLLGGGMSARLHQNVREKYGYCYSIQSMIQSYVDTGLFAVYVGTDKEYLDHVTSLIFDELDKMAQEFVSEKELSDAKTQLKGLLLLGQENMSNRMTRLAKSDIYYKRYIPLSEIEERINGVTASDLRSFCEQFLVKEDFTETILQPVTKENS